MALEGLVQLLLVSPLPRVEGGPRMKKVRAVAGVVQW